MAATYSLGLLQWTLPLPPAINMQVAGAALTSHMRHKALSYAKNVPLSPAGTGFI